MPSPLLQTLNDSTTASPVGASSVAVGVGALVAAAVALAVTLCFGPASIRWLQKRCQEPLETRSEVLSQLHRHKQSTPTMGGLFVMLAILVALIVTANFSNPTLPLGVALIAAFTALGFVDDRAKLRRSAGLSARNKFLVQSGLAIAAAAGLYWIRQSNSETVGLIVPFAGAEIDLGIWFIPLAALVLVGSTNATNLTDGLDGLASGCLVVAMGTFGLLAYLAGQHDAVVLSAATVGALLGFLWFNRRPARVFLGDTGSLPLGGLLAYVAILSRQELLLLIIGGVFVAEAMSVIIQVAVFKLRRRRVFLCAPLHHHFQFLGWSESKVVSRFWAASLLCAMAGFSVATLSSPNRSGTTERAEPASVATADVAPNPRR